MQMLLSFITTFKYVEGNPVKAKVPLRRSRRNRKNADKTHSTPSNTPADDEAVQNPIDNEEPSGIALCLTKNVEYTCIENYIFLLLQ